MYDSSRTYEASVHVNGRPVKEVHHRGHTYIEGRKGTEYTLHFKNNYRPRGLGTHRVLVIPSVDGLSVIDGKPAGRNSAGFIVDGRGGSIDIPGWMVDNVTAAKFEFHPQDAKGEATYVEELEKSGANVDVGNQGMIGFLVIEEHFTPTLQLTGYHSPKDHGIWRSAGFNSTDMPRGITASSSGGVSQTLNCSNASVGSTLDSAMLADTGLGTKFGESTEFKTRQEHDFKRGRVLAELVIEYDTMRGLKDRGVPVDMFKGSAGKKYRGRTAFPASQVGCEPPAGWDDSSSNSFVDKVAAAKTLWKSGVKKKSEYEKFFGGKVWKDQNLTWKEFKALFTLGT